jgi:hypothetical protein
MGMGHLRLRKSFKQETMWIDKKADKHKHEFEIHSILEEKSPSGNITYYNVLKCNKCNSFESISEKGNISGVINRDLNDFEKTLPVIKAIKKHEYIIGFNDIDTIE